MVRVDPAGGPASGWVAVTEPAGSAASTTWPPAPPRSTELALCEPTRVTLSGLALAGSIAGVTTVSDSASPSVRCTVCRVDGLAPAAAWPRLTSTVWMLVRVRGWPKSKAPAPDKARVLFPPPPSMLVRWAKLDAGVVMTSSPPLPVTLKMSPARVRAAA